MPVDRDVFDPAHLGVLTDQLPVELVDEVLAACRRGERRVRLLPARVMVFFLLAMTLFPERGYAGVWRALSCRLRGGVVPSAAALRQARARLGEAPVKMLFDRVRGPVAPAGLAGAWWRGLRLVAWDGSTLDLADEPPVRAAFGAPVHGSGREGAPQMAFAVTVECGTRAILDAVWGHRRTSEPVLAEGMLGCLRPGMLLLADRCFAALRLWQAARGTGAQLLWRAPARLSGTLIQRLPDGSCLVERRGYAKGERHLRVLVRLIEAEITIRLADGRTRRESYKLMTTLIDHRAFPAADLMACYRQRWEIETALSGLKAVHKGSLRPLRSRTVTGVLQEFYALLLTHHLLRRLICHAALDTGLDPDQISFTITLHTTRDSLITGMGTRPCQAAQDWEHTLAQITTRPAPATRRPRTSPRVKNRPKVRYPFRNTHPNPKTQTATYHITIHHPPSPSPSPSLTSTPTT
ncbi:IS4 family transposase [Acrocarpospora pleiomorpha]